LTAFEITAWNDGSIRVVRMSGEFDVNTCAAFETAVGAGCHELVVIDLREASFIDSHGLGLLIALHGRAQEAGFRLAIIRPEGEADRIFSITGTDGHLPLYDERVPILAQINYG
jgi:anti-sigma B factor antagonist